VSRTDLRWICLLDASGAVLDRVASLVNGDRVVVRARCELKR